ncbi:lipopolysaccharide cholinephosphotransferase [Sharpea azabuensis]|uniref:LicD family protein n=1 Tax=Sharpea azabuensis TaxID=322505 RepID=UPI0008E6B8A0|nr:LicD family protein [Sharpea azabuensis]SFD55384.1 lipopolysaccharide cholinephosphotransferase [Sharpea azabuensis]SFK55706.1 lipopolysaccharide cholinephosphotransferase [Sharpea azabuensis]
MKSSKAIYSSIFNDLILSQEDLDKLHKALFSMLIDIKAVCEQNNITFFLAGGSALGAVRHKGFIPWDDDLDIMMFRSEYIKFRSLFLNELRDKYDLVEPLEEGYTQKKPKLFLKKSVFKEITSDGLPERFNRLFIDIFLIEDVPASKIKRKILGNFYNFAFSASSLIADYKYPSRTILEKGKINRDLLNYYKLRRRMGFLFNILGGMHLYIKITQVLSHSKKETGWVAIPSGISYNREVFRKNIFEDMIKVSFNGELFNIPKNYDLYLTNLYGDYMKIPPIEERQVHSTTEFKILK